MTDETTLAFDEGAECENAARELGEDGGGITAEGIALGHRYIMGNVNCYCPKCSDEHGVCVLGCDYDLDK